MSNTTVILVLGIGKGAANIADGKVCRRPGGSKGLINGPFCWISPVPYFFMSWSVKGNLVIFIFSQESLIKALGGGQQNS